MAAQGESIARLGQATMGVAQMMLKEVTAEIFARQPKDAEGRTINCNHPCFVLGHLSIYPDKTLGMLGLESEHTKNPEGFADLFAAGKPCQDDPAGVIYPSMETVIEHFTRSHEALLQALPTIPEERFAVENPNEGMRTRLGLQTLGEALTFLVTSHAQMHLGQLSTWRRVMGLGSAMG
jgi:hypothetical protein